MGTLDLHPQTKALYTQAKCCSGGGGGNTMSRLESSRRKVVCILTWKLINQIMNDSHTSLRHAEKSVRQELPMLKKDTQWPKPPLQIGCLLNTFLRMSLCRL